MHAAVILGAAIVVAAAFNVGALLAGHRGHSRWHKVATTCGWMGTFFLLSVPFALLGFGVSCIEEPPPPIAFAVVQGTMGGAGACALSSLVLCVIIRRRALLARGEHEE